ncbi:MAG: molybdenum cofactor guanylyltransferase [Myxococcota bacterium]
MIDHPDITAGILVGGRGRRMGYIDKAQLTRTDGRSYLQHLVSELRPCVAEILLLGRDDQRFTQAKFPLIADRLPDTGPMSGLESLLSYSVTPWGLLVACDMPAFDARLVSLLARARDDAAEVIVPESQGRCHPVCALYRSELGDAVTVEIDAGRLALQDFLKQRAVCAVSVPADLEGALLNVNHPQDLARPD